MHRCPLAQWREDGLFEHGKDYVAAAEKAGATAELEVAEGQAHGFFNRGPWLGKTTRRMDEFLVELGYLPAK